MCKYIFYFKNKKLMIFIKEVKFKISQNPMEEVFWRNCVNTMVFCMYIHCCPQNDTIGWFVKK